MTYVVTIVANCLCDDEQRGEEAGEDKIEEDQSAGSREPFAGRKTNKLLLSRLLAGCDECWDRELRDLQLREPHVGYAGTGRGRVASCETLNEIELKLLGYGDARAETEALIRREDKMQARRVGG